ncbi:MAG: ATP-binding protein [Candidatus Sumerlaeia bacterium]
MFADSSSPQSSGKNVFVGTPVSEQPVALILDEQRESREYLEAALERFGYIVQSAGSPDTLWQHRGQCFRHLFLTVLSSTFPGLDDPEKAPKLLDLFPCVPLVRLGDGERVLENKRRGIIEVCRLDRPVETEALSEAVGHCQTFHNAVYDVIERKLFQNQSRYLEEPLARIIHDLNNQITGLKGGIDLMGYAVDMMQDMENQSKFTRYMEQFIKPSLAQIETMVRNWRQLRDNRLKASVNVYLAALVQDAVALVAEPYQRRFVSIREEGREISLDEDLGASDDQIKHVQGNTNPDQMVLGLSHVIQNALEAVEDKADARILVEISDQDDGMCAVEIFDNGPGIPENEENHIWRSFYTNKGASRNGMGLSIAKQVVDKFQGQIECVRSPLGGAGIRILVPKSSNLPLR